MGCGAMRCGRAVQCAEDLERKRCRADGRNGVRVISAVEKKIVNGRG